MKIDNSYLIIFLLDKTIIKIKIKKKDISILKQEKVIYYIFNLIN